MKAFLLRFFIFLSGGLTYGLIEILFRGFTHWSMLIVGGLCCVLLHFISLRQSLHIWQKCVLGGAAITTIEFVAGAVVNIALGWAVWDYSSQPFNLMGQICPMFSIAWTALSFPAIVLFQKADRLLQGR